MVFVFKCQKVSLRAFWCYIYEGDSPHDLRNYETDLILPIYQKLNFLKEVSNTMEPSIGVFSHVKFIVLLLVVVVVLPSCSLRSLLFYSQGVPSGGGGGGS